MFQIIPGSPKSELRTAFGDSKMALNVNGSLAESICMQQRQRSWKGEKLLMQQTIPSNLSAINKLKMPLSSATSEPFLLTATTAAKKSGESVLQSGITAFNNIWKNGRICKKTKKSPLNHLVFCCCLWFKTLGLKWHRTEKGEKSWIDGVTVECYASAGQRRKRMKPCYKRWIGITDCWAQYILASWPSSTSNTTVSKKLFPLARYLESGGIEADQKWPRDHI